MGIFEVGLQEHDSVLALINLEDAEAFRGLAVPTGIRLKFDDVLQAPELAARAPPRGLRPGLQVRDWTQDNEAYFRAIRIEKTMMGLILMLIVAVAVFNIVATLVMVVNDKRTDIAILRTLGMSPRGVVAVFMTQGVLIGWIGAATRRGPGTRLSPSTSMSSCPSSSRPSAFTSWTTPTCTTSPGCRARCTPATWCGSEWPRCF